MHLHKAMVFSLIVLLCSCSERNVHDDKGPYEPEQPAYGTQGTIKGYYRWGFETSAIHLCAVNREECLSSISSDDGCWVEFTEAAYRQLIDLRGDGDNRDVYGEIWLEGSGRIAKKPGNFGHMSTFACQVELAAIHAIDPETRGAFEPPPSQIR